MGVTLIGPSTLFMGSMMFRYDVIEWILNKLCISCSNYVLNVTISYCACMVGISISALHNPYRNYYYLYNEMPLLIVFDDI